MTEPTPAELVARARTLQPLMRADERRFWEALRNSFLGSAFFCVDLRPKPLFRVFVVLFVLQPAQRRSHRPPGGA